MGGFSDEDEATVMDFNIIASCLSLLGSLFILIAFWAFQDLRIFAFKLVALLSLADFFNSISLLLGPMREEDDMCIVQAILISYFSVTSVLCTANIAFVLYQGVVMQRPNIDDMFYKLWAFSYGVPVFTTMLPLATNSYGEDVGYCWLDADHFGHIWKVLQFYLPLWFVIGFNIYCYVKVHQTVSAMLEVLGMAKIDEDKRRRLKLIKRLKYYPFILIICWVFGTINRIYNFAEPEDPLLWLTIIHVTLGSINGLFNAIVYGISGPVKYHIIRSCFPCLAAPRKKQEVSTPNEEEPEKPVPNFE